MTQWTIEMHVYKCLLYLEKLEFDKIMSMLQKKWFIVSAIRRLMDALGKLLSTREAWVAIASFDLNASLVLSILPRASITRQTSDARALSRSQLLSTAKLFKFHQPPFEFLSPGAVVVHFRFYKQKNKRRKIKLKPAQWTNLTQKGQTNDEFSFSGN